MSFPSSAIKAWDGVLNPRHLRGVRFVVRTISWISWSDVRSISRWRGSHRRRRPLAFSMPPFSLRASLHGCRAGGLAPVLGGAEHCDQTDFDDHAGGSLGKRLLANKLGVGCALVSRLRVEATSRSNPSRKF